MEIPEPRIANFVSTSIRMDESEDEAVKFIEGEIFYFDFPLPKIVEVDGEVTNCFGGYWKKKMIQRFVMEEEGISKVPDLETKAVSKNVLRPVPAPRTIFTPIPASRSALSLASEVADGSTQAVLPSPRVSLPVPAPRALSGISTSLNPVTAVPNKAAAAAGTNPTPAVMSFTSQPPVTAAVKPSLVPTPEATSTFAVGTDQNVTFDSGGGGNQRMQPVRRIHHEPMPRGCAVKFVFISRTFFLLADVFYPDDDNVNDPQVNPDVLAYVLESDDCHDPLDHIAIAGALPILGKIQVRHLFHEIMPSLVGQIISLHLQIVAAFPGTL